MIRRGERVSTVTLDGSPAAYRVVPTHRGPEVLVHAGTADHRALEVRTTG